MCEVKFREEVAKFCIETIFKPENSMKIFSGEWSDPC